MTKLTIVAYSDSKFSNKSGEFKTQINPEKISHSKSIVYKQSRKANNAGTPARFKSMGSEKVSFDLIFDGTGILENNAYVDKTLVELDKTIYKYKGKHHKPNFLKVIWSSFVFKCQLESIKTEYTLFNNSGRPIRAKVSLSLFGFMDEKTREKEAKKRSPDVSHLYTVREGDHITHLCKEVYETNKSHYYVQVAAANNLANFRFLNPGAQIHLPPLEK